MLIHRTAEVLAYWYEVILLDHETWKTGLRRVDKPKLVIRAKCGMAFFGGSVPRSKMCAVPSPEATLCGRCHGEEATLRRGHTFNRAELIKRIGCIAEVS